MTEPTFTLDEARAELARRECGAHGHDWNVICSGLGAPVKIACGRCGVAYAVASQIPHDVVVVYVAREIAQRFEGKWTRIADLEADEFKVTLQGDGTAEVLLCVGERPA